MMKLEFGDLASTEVERRAIMGFMMKRASARPSAERFVVRAMRGMASALPADVDPAVLAREAALPTRLDALTDDAYDDGAFDRVWRALWRQHPDPTLPLSVGAALPIGTYEVVDYLGETCTNVGAGLVALSRYFELIISSYWWQIDDSGSLPSVTLNARGAELEHRRLFVQFILGVTFGRLRQFSQLPLEFVEVDLAFDPPADPSVHQAFFRCPVRYRRAVSRCVLTRATWNAPLGRSEPDLHRILERCAQDRLARTRGADAPEPLSQVRLAIREQLGAGPLALAAVARRAAMSTRTVQRRLRENGTTFQALIDHERQLVAERHLDRGASLADVALRLGYSEASAFSRAYQRWTGLPPRAREAPSSIHAPRPSSG